MSFITTGACTIGRKRKIFALGDKYCRCGAEYQCQCERPIAENNSAKKEIIS